MVSSLVGNLVHDIKTSSVTTSQVTGVGKLCEFGYMDLAMKLHYIRAVYFFKCDAVQGIDNYALKKTIFEWLDLYYPAAGRIRHSENGFPFIKCNDAGIRIVEAKCDMSIDEWLGSKDRCKNDEQLVPSQVLGPELGFSPLVYLQMTRFSCGGMSVGLNWAHILGDSFSALAFINTWGHKISQSQVPRQHLTGPDIPNHQKSPNLFSEKPQSLKTIDPVGDTWLIPNAHKMETCCFHVTEKVLLKAEKQKKFSFLTAMLWKSISKIRETETKIVTICGKGSERRGNKIPDNSQIIGTIEADFSIEEANLLDLAKWVEEKMVDERSVIEDYVEKDNRKSDFIFYGANLTFVNLEEANIEGLEIQGKKPIYANLVVTGVGEGGAVLVLPRAKEGGVGGRTMTVILQENEIVELKDILRKEWGIF